MQRIFGSLGTKSFFCLFIFVISLSSSAVAFSTLLITFKASPDDSRIYAISEAAQSGSKTLLTTDISTGKVIKKIPLPLTPYPSKSKPRLVITPDEKKLYIVDIDKNLYVIDIQSDKITKIKNKPKQDIGIETSSAMTLTADGKYLYVADGVAQLHSPAVIHRLDTATDKIMLVVPGEKGWWQGSSVLDNSAARLYVSNLIDYWHSEISIMDTRTHRLEKSPVQIDHHMESIALNATNGLLYVVGKECVYVINSFTKEIVDTISISTPGRLSSITFALHDSKFYLINATGTEDDGIISFDMRTKKTRFIPLYVSFSDSEIQASANGEKIYVSYGFENVIHIVDTRTDTVTGDLEILNS